jgi:hypothetical protein
MAWADLIHVSHQPVADDKPQVVQFHGTKFRNNPAKFLDLVARAGAKAVCSTLDLWLLAPDLLTWLPTPYEADFLAAFRRPLHDGVLRIAHAPTARPVKSTDAFIAAVRRLGREMRVELVLIERQSWHRCLRRKGQADIYFDQVILGYGNNAVEAWGMGIPVIAGAQPETLGEMEDRFGILPFLAATEDTIYEALVEMAETREAWAERGRLHFERFHEASRVVGLLENIYDFALSG